MGKRFNNPFPKNVTILAAIAAVVFCGTYLTLSLTQNTGHISEESAVRAMNRLYKNIRVTEMPGIRENVDLEAIDVAGALPDISKYPAQVEQVPGTESIEIFSSTEKATVRNGRPDSDRWLVDMANAFNNSRQTIGGRRVSVSVRGLASGLAMDYISSGKHVPDAYTPSNELWGDALKALGTDADLVCERLVGNVAGIVIHRDKHREFIKKYGAVSVKTVTESVEAGELTMGYTNPFASSTGVNFLMAMLYAFNESDPLSDSSRNAFTSFQTRVPFVAYTTLQMKESAKSGVLDGFVFEYQQFANAPDINTDYVFTPFGVRHDSPVYALGKPQGIKRDILERFIEFCKTPEAQKTASEYGFNEWDDYVSGVTRMSGALLPQAQRLFKEKKAGGRAIMAVFVADVSGSMAGTPLTMLKKSLIEASKSINREHYIGIAQFSDNVQIALPIGKFDINKRSLLTGAVRNMQAGGGTAMFDGIVVAEKMIHDAKAANPDAKPMIFVLSDGETTSGASFADAKPMIAGLRVPIYTIGYNANVDVLSEVSAINEAVSVTADTDDVIYNLLSLFNAEM